MAEKHSVTENGKPSVKKGIGKQSSIGDVKTLRTRLQDRRESLNEEIEKENRMKKGSKKLIGASLDHKIKDQAALEMNFADSKIRVLQAELTKINSSIQAYQAEGTQDTQVPIIPLALKTTTKINFVLSFTETISNHYHRDPSELEESIYRFQELRCSLSSLNRDDTGVELLYQYYNQLQLVSRRLLHSRIRHGIAFIWYDAINGLPAGQQGVTFEKACTLFNMGALYSQIAAQQDRSTSQGIDAAVKYLEKAIGCFEYMKDKFSHSPTMDMTSEMLALFSDLMRAQAQEVLWEKDRLAGLQDNIPSWIGNAHRSKSIADCYRPIKELLDEDAVKEYMPDCWIAVIKIKEAHYKALAHYYAAVTHEKLATTYSEGGQIAEDVRTELHFLYIDTPQEVLSTIPKHHVGLMKAHLNCATLSHEYALKYNSLCKDLLPVVPLYDMLEEASEGTRLKKLDADNLDGIMVIAPVIQPADVALSAISPDFTATKVQDIFRTLGPLPVFSGENSWSSPRTVTLKKGDRGFGFSLRGSKPAVVSGVDKGGQAAIAGVNVKDWLLSVNGSNMTYLSHREVVKAIKDGGEEVTLEITTPTSLART